MKLPEQTRSNADLSQQLALLDQLINANQLDQAHTVVDGLIQQYPKQYIAYFKRGYIYLKQRSLRESVDSLEKALSLQPNAADVTLMLASAYLGLEDADRAIYYYELKADDLKISEVYHALANLYHQKENHVKAEINYRKALKVKPDAVDVMLDYASILLYRIVFSLEVDPNWIEQALGYSDLAIKGSLDSRRWEGYELKANLYKMTDRLDEAIEMYREAIKLKPDEVPLHTNLSTVLLAKGRFDEAAREMHWRWQLTDYEYGFHTSLKIDVPIWKGEDIAGKRLLVRPEQGVGDQVLAVQHFKALLEKGIDVLFVCEPKMHSLLRRSMPEVVITGDGDPEVLEMINRSDRQIYLMDLLHTLNIQADTYVAPEPYLVPDPQLSRQYAQRYSELFGKKLKVGIAWKSFSQTYGERKSLMLPGWEDILKAEGVQFVSVQYGDTKEDIEQVKSLFNIDIYNDTTVDPIKDLESAAAQLDALDLVISVSNAGAHMAAAIGKPTWLLLSCAPLWHWLSEGSKSIWYKNTRLFRQKSLGDWSNVVDQVAKELRDVLRDRND